MTREEIQAEIIRILEELFEFDNPGLEDNLRDVHGFDSIDAIELLGEIERMLGFAISREEKQQAMEIRTISDILNYIEALMAERNK